MGAESEILFIYLLMLFTFLYFILTTMLPRIQLMIDLLNFDYFFCFKYWSRKIVGGDF